MSRTTSVQMLSSRVPTLGLIVLFHPPRRTEQTPDAVPAIIHHISDSERGVVDLTIFTGQGCVIRPNVVCAGEPREGHWTYPK